MIWLTEEHHREILEDPRMQAAEEVALRLQAWAQERQTVEAIQAAVRAAEVTYWLTKDLAAAIETREEARAADAARGNGHVEP